MTNYITEIHLRNNGGLRARNGNGRSANYLNSYHERTRSNYHKKRNSYTLRRTPAVVIIHDPLSFCDGGFIAGATFTEEDWAAMRSQQVITENTVYKQDGRIWQMVTFCDTFGNQFMKRVRVEEQCSI